MRTSCSLHCSATEASDGGNGDGTGHAAQGIETQAQLNAIRTQLQDTSNAEQVLASVDHQKEVLEKSSSLLAELNPVYKEKQETEKRFSAIEETVTGVKGSVDELKKMMSDFIKKMS